MPRSNHYETSVVLYLLELFLSYKVYSIYLRKGMRVGIGKSRSRLGTKSGVAIGHQSRGTSNPGGMSINGQFRSQTLIAYILMFECNIRFWGPIQV